MKKGYQYAAKGAEDVMPGTNVWVENLDGTQVGQALVTGLGKGQALKFLDHFSISNIKGPGTLIGFDFWWKNQQKTVLVITPRWQGVEPAKPSLAQIIAQKKDEIGEVFKTAEPAPVPDPPTIGELNDIAAKIKKFTTADAQTKQMVGDFQQFGLGLPQTTSLIKELQSYCFHHKMPFLAGFDHMFKGVITNPFKDPKYIPEVQGEKDHWANLFAVASEIAQFDSKCLGPDTDCSVCSQSSVQSINDTWADNYVNPFATKGYKPKSKLSLFGDPDVEKKPVFFDVETKGINLDYQPASGGVIKDQNGDVIGIAAGGDKVTLAGTVSATGNTYTTTLQGAGLKITQLDENGNPIGEVVELGIADEGKVTNNVKAFLDFVSDHNMKKHWSPSVKQQAVDLTAPMTDVEVSEALAGIAALFKINSFTKGVKAIVEPILNQRMTYLKANPPKTSPLKVPIFNAVKKLPKGEWNEGHWKVAELAAEKTLEGEWNPTFYTQVLKWFLDAHKVNEFSKDQYHQGCLALDKIAKQKAATQPEQTKPGLKKALDNWKTFCLNVPAGFSSANLKFAVDYAGQVFALCDDDESVTNLGGAMVSWVNEQNPKYPSSTSWSNGAKMSVMKAKDSWVADAVAHKTAEDALNQLKDKLYGGGGSPNPVKASTLTTDQIAAAKNFNFLKTVQSLKSDGAMQYEELSEVGGHVAKYFDYLDQFVNPDQPKKAFKLWANWLSKSAGTILYVTKWQMDNMWQVICYHSGAPQKWVDEFVPNAPDKIMPPAKKKAKPNFFNDDYVVKAPPPLNPISAELHVHFTDGTVSKSLVKADMKKTMDSVKIHVDVNEPMSSFLGSVGALPPKAEPVIPQPAEKPVKATKPKASADTEVIHIKKGEQVIFLAEDEQYVTVPKGTKFTHIKR